MMGITSLTLASYVVMNLIECTLSVALRIVSLNIEGSQKKALNNLKLLQGEILSNVALGIQPGWVGFPA